MKRLEGNVRRDLQQAYFRLVVPNFGNMLSGSECRMFQFLCDKSLRFGQYSAWISAGQFRDGDRKHGIAGFPDWRPRNIRQVRDQVKRRNFIFYEIDYSNPNRAVEYTINVPGVWTLLRRMFIDIKDSDVQNYLAVLERSVHDFGEAGYERGDFEVITDKNLEKGIMKIEDAIKTGEKISAKGKLYKSRRRSQKELRPFMIRRLMTEYCEEVGVKYAEPGWTGKEAKSAVNWLNYCKGAGHDPREILFEVCKFWKSFRSGAILRDNRTQIVLKDTVSFWQFYQYRREIGAWIKANRDRVTESQSEWAAIGEEFRRKRGEN